MTPPLTLGEFRRQTAHLPDDTLLAHACDDGDEIVRGWETDGVVVVTEWATESVVRWDGRCTRRFVEQVPVRTEPAIRLV